MVRLNLGSGQRRFEGHGWINVDRVSRPGQEPDVICDLGRDRLPYEDGAVDTVVAHHVWEHLDAFREGPASLRECHRVLRPGGSLLVFVPNLRTLAQRWLAREIDDYTYCTNLYGAYLGEESDRHRWGWSPDSLREWLNQVTWSWIGDFDGRQIPGADLVRDWWITCIEAVK